MSYWHGRFETEGSFSTYCEKGDGFMEMDGSVYAVCDWDRGDRDTPGSVEYEVDYDSTSVWGDVGWVDAEGEVHSLTIRLDGQDADNFLSGWGIDVSDYVEEWEDGHDL